MYIENRDIRINDDIKLMAKTLTTEYAEFKSELYRIVEHICIENLTAILPMWENVSYYNLMRLYHSTKKRDEYKISMIGMKNVGLFR